MIANLAHGKTVNVSTINAINRQIKNQSGSIEVRKSENGFEKLFRADLRDRAT
jgi:hypothetical protein